MPDTCPPYSGGFALPIGPNPSKNFYRARTRRVFPGSIPSRSENFGRTRRSLFSPRGRGVHLLRLAVFSRQFWFRWPRRGASLVRTKCRSGGISNTQILPDAAGIHKPILSLSRRFITPIFSSLWRVSRFTEAGFQRDYSGRPKAPEGTRESLGIRRKFNGFARAPVRCAWASRRSGSGWIRRRAGGVGRRIVRPSARN